MSNKAALISLLIIMEFIASFAFTALSAATPNVFFGLHFNNLSGDSYLPATPWPTALQFGSYRDQGTYASLWSKIETSRGVYNWTVYDGTMQPNIDNGMDIICAIFSTPTWANAAKDSKAPPDNLQDLADYATALVQHNESMWPGKIIHYEGWNEPITGGGFFDGTMAQLIAVQQTWYNAIKAANPHAIVHGPAWTIGGTSPIQYPACLPAFLSGGGAAVSDMEDVHLYVYSATPESYLADNPGVLGYSIPVLQATLNANGMAGKQIWCTEGGYGEELGFTADNSAGITKAGYLARWYLIQYVEGISRAFWYMYDGGTSPASPWGQLHIPGTSYVSDSPGGWPTRFTRDWPSLPDLPMHWVPSNLLM
jgi:hypothetical protein